MANIFLKNLLLSLLLIGFFCVLLPSAAFAFDFNKDTGLNTVADETGHTKIASNGTDITARISGAIMPLLGVAYLVLMMYAGYLWMAASGNEDRVAKAKKIITAATIGLLIAFMSYAISFFVVSSFQGGLVR